MSTESVFQPFSQSKLVHLFEVLTKAHETFAIAPQTAKLMIRYYSEFGSSLINDNHDHTSVEDAGVHEPVAVAYEPT